MDKWLDQSIYTYIKDRENTCSEDTTASFIVSKEENTEVSKALHVE
mgnify:CR=1 FL=1